MLLAGILWARPESATAYSAKPPAAELITRSPGLKSLTSAPTASTSPAHSRPTMVPGPPTVPWRLPEATARSARLSDAALTLIRISLALGEGLGASLYWTPLSVTTAAFMVVSLNQAITHSTTTSALGLALDVFPHDGVVRRVVGRRDRRDLRLDALPGAVAADIDVGVHGHAD